MAKRKKKAAATAGAPRSQSLTILTPAASAPRGLQRLKRRAAKGLRGGGYPLMPVALGGAIVGYLDGAGYLERLPALGGSRMITLGVVGYAVVKYAKNPSLRAAGLAALAAAAFDYGKSAGGGKASGDVDI